MADDTGADETPHHIARRTHGIIHSDDSPVPASVQLANILRRRIERGEYHPGQRLPSVSNLMQTFDVARATAHKAHAILIREGLAVSSPGLGVYVKPADDEAPGQDDT